MNRTSSRILGFSKIFLSLIWIIGGILGIFYGLKGLQHLETSALDNLNSVKSNIELLKQLINNSIDVVETTDQSLSTIEQSSIDAGLGLVDTRPMIAKTSQVVTQDLPLALSEIQASMPSVIGTAALIDQTLYVLSRFRFRIPNPFGTDLEMSLGIDYQPEIPMEEALIQLSENIEGIPERMRSLETDLNITNSNLGTMSENLINVAYDLDLIREQVADIIPIFDLMINNLDSFQASIEQTSAGIPRFFRTTRVVLISIMVFVILNQIPSIYWSYHLVQNEN